MKYKAISVVIAICSLFISAGVSAGEQSPGSKLNEYLATAEPCYDKVKKEIHDAIGQPPTVDSLESLAHWTRIHLPRVYQDALSSAAINAVEKAKPQTLAELASDKEKFWSVLFRSGFWSMMGLKGYEDCGGGGVVEEVMINELDRDLHLTEGMTHERFKKLSLDDGYDIEYAFMDMLILDAAGVNWQDEWFDGYSKWHGEGKS